jgi:hypothetical protein
MSHCWLCGLKETSLIISPRLQTVHLFEERFFAVEDAYACGPSILCPLKAKKSASNRGR